MAYLDKNRRDLTYQDYLDWPTDERWELIDGVYYLSAAPNTEHQRISMNLATKIRNFLEDKPCEVFAAPFDVQLCRDEEKEKLKNVNIKTNVQPDISVICDKSKLHEQGCLGAPDLIIEIISPNHRTQDYIIKLGSYSKFDVKEYWIVDPLVQQVAVYCRDAASEMFISGTYGINEIVKCVVLDGLEIKTSEIFG